MASAKSKNNLDSGDALRLCSETFGARLRRMRVTKPLSQAEFAAELGGFRGDTISRIERGDATGVPFDLLTAIAQWATVEHVSLAWLFAGIGPVDESEAADSTPTAQARIAELVRLIKGVGESGAAGAGPGASAAPPWLPARRPEHSHWEAATSLSQLLALLRQAGVLAGPPRCRPSDQ